MTDSLVRGPFADGGDDDLAGAAFDALPAQVAVIDAEGVILRTNDAWHDFAVENGMPGDATMVGENYLAACDAAEDDETAAETAAGIRSVLAGERETFSLEYPCHSPDERRWFIVRVIALPGDAGRALVMHTDITDRKEAELRVRANNETLERVASVLSHDLRNPLTVVLARAEHLQGTPDTDVETVAEQAEAVVSSARRMEAIIDDALVLARGTEAIDPASVDLGTVAAGAWSHVATGDATLTVGDTATVEADKGLLSQLFENLFRNAIDHGGPDVTVTVSATPDGFVVADDGPGVPDDERDRIFEAGYSTGDGDNTGMGLAIVETIAETHGWSVALADEDGVAAGDGSGACFVFSGVTTI